MTGAHNSTKALKQPSPETFFFYDLETSGLNPRSDRIMQFAGQRTTLDLEPIGDPVNLLVKLADDTLPSPEAIMVTKITPQSTVQDGLSEAEFCKYLSTEIFTENTIATGYNSARFDDEFMRYLFWRNFYDPYEWQWKDGRSHWDLLDVVRMTRALRPDGINWPVTEEGRATNRLELITKLNHISHESAHDALSDVNALIDVSRLIKQHQPKLFDYLFRLRHKKSVQALVNLAKPLPFVYSSGRYSADHDKTTVAFPIAPARHGNVLVFDLRYNLDEVLAKKAAEKRESQTASGASSPSDKASTFFPIIKELKYNHCPAVAPLSVLESAHAWQNIHLDRATIDKHLKILLAHPDLIERVREQYEKMPEFPKAKDAEAALYDAFLDRPDRTRCDAVKNASLRDLADFHPDFDDPRLPELLLHYKARNYPDALSEAEQSTWEQYRLARLAAQQGSYLESLKKLASENADSFLIEELSLWLQSLLPY
ncbi:exodeoxyribonuclease I [Candidatus Saccharibacteria bacterium]|nr:exodeoxyribonuclease I [Candidatus Saccharibacteria bacterium]